MPFDGEHFDAPLPGLDHSLFAPHGDVELVDGEINDRLEFSALYSVGDHDFVTGKQPTYVQNNANKLRRSAQMAGHGIQLFGTSRWEDNLQTCLLYPAPPALLNIGTKDFTILAVFQTDAGGDTNHGTQFLTSIANAGGSVTNREMAGVSFNTYNTFDRAMTGGMWDSSTGYSISAPAGTCVHKRTQVALFTRCRGVMSLWAFGQRLAGAANTATLTGTGSLCVGALKVVDGGSPWYGVTGYIHLVSWWSRGMVDAEAVERSANPFAQYRPMPLLVGWRKPSDAAVTGTGGGTLAAITASAAGSVAVAGAASATLAAITASSAGAVAVDAAAAGTLAPITGSAAGSVAVAGTAAATLGAITGAAAAAVAIEGAAAATLAAITGSAADSSSVLGEGAGTLAAITGAASATVAIAAAAAATLAPVTGAAAATVGVAATAAATLAAITGAGAATVAVAGAAAGTLAPVTSSGAATVRVLGVVSATLAPITVTSFELVDTDGLSIRALRSVLAEETDEVWLLLLTIDHDSLAEPIRVAQNHEHVTSRGQLFAGYPFDLDLPGDAPGEQAHVTLRIDNIGVPDEDDPQMKRVSDYLRAIDSPFTATIEVVLASQPDIVEAGPFELECRQAEYDAAEVSAELGFENLLDEPYPADSFVPATHPGLF